MSKPEWIDKYTKQCYYIIVAFIASCLVLAVACVGITILSIIGMMARDVIQGV